jgi:hypothetical protein
MTRGCLIFSMFLFGSAYVLADDVFLLTIENNCGRTVTVKNRSGNYSTVKAYGDEDVFVSNDVYLENGRSIEFSIMSRPSGKELIKQDVLEISSDDEEKTELIIEPASLDSSLMHISQAKNALMVIQELRPSGIGYKVIVPPFSRSTPSQRQPFFIGWLFSIFRKFC